MLLKFKCNLCNNSISKLVKSGTKRPGYIPCECGGVMELQNPEFGVTSAEVVDNGNMMKKVELRRDAAAKAKERGDIYNKIMEERDSVIKKDNV